MQDYRVLDQGSVGGRRLVLVDNKKVLVVKIHVHKEHMIKEIYTQ